MSRKNTAATSTLLLILIAAVALNLFLFRSLISNTTPRDNVDLRETLPADEEEEPEEASGPVYPAGYVPITVSSDEVFSGEVLLVNADHEYHFEAPSAVCRRESPASVYESKTDRYYIKDLSIYLNPTVIERLNTMFEAYHEYAGKADVLINSAYRTFDEQQEMLEYKIAELGEEQGRLTAANPGFSEHHTGYAFDICVYENGQSRTFDTEGTRSWVVEHAADYGFIQRYPEGKTAITGITYEPWHYRYVGLPHSSYIASNGLCLEEYIERVKSYTVTGSHLAVDAVGKTYEVYYVPAGNGTTAVWCPSDKPYTITGNNVDGFIVAVDMSAPLPTDEPAEEAPAGEDAAQ